MTNEGDILHNVISVVGEICVLVKVLPKREHLLGNVNLKYRERRFWNVRKVKKALSNQIVSSCRMYEKSHW